MNQVQAAGDLRSGELRLTNYLSRVESYFSSREPSVLAFIPEENRLERLRNEAETLLARFPDPEGRPPLFSMLAGVKDIFHVRGFVTLAGSRLPARELQGAEAESVMRLKNSGALILGKTVTTEFAYFSPGPTRNPHAPDHTPGGSSSGSAAAVAAGSCHLALGTQTIGSIIRPASFCGVVGFKPSYDRISRQGVIPLAPSLDHVGFFTPDVATAQQVAAALIGDWSPAASASEGSRVEGRKPVLGIPAGPYLQSASEEGRVHFEKNCELLGTKYEIHSIPVMPDFQEIRARHDVILSAEAAQVHRAWFEKYENLYSAKFVELIRRGKSITEIQLQAALDARDKFRAELIQAMSDHDIDLWICPSTMGPAPKGLDGTGDPVMNLPWTQAGLPAINIPAGRNQEDLPMGLQLIGNWYKDEQLLAGAKEIEKAVGKP